MQRQAGTGRRNRREEVYAYRTDVRKRVLTASLCASYNRVPVKGTLRMLAVRIEKILMRRLDSFVARLPAGFNRSQVARAALILGLEKLEGDPGAMVSALSESLKSAPARVDDEEVTR